MAILIPIPPKTHHDEMDIWYVHHFSDEPKYGLAIARYRMILGAAPMDAQNAEDHQAAVAYARMCGKRVTATICTKDYLKAHRLMEAGKQRLREVKCALRLTGADRAAV